MAMEAREARGGGKGAMRLFGVTICGGSPEEEAEGGGEEVLRKSKSMGNLASAGQTAENGAGERGYLSDGGLRNRKPTRRRRRSAVGPERKKGIPWTEEEHRTFLEGLEKLGKGDWRGISRKFVTTRTPTQVASHAQKYFIRQSIPRNKKRRSSLFDVVINDSACASETVPMISNDNELLCQVNNKVGTPELTSGLPSSLGPERHPGLHFVANHSAAYMANSVNCMSRESGFMKDQPACNEHNIFQTSTCMLDDPKYADSVRSNMHTHQCAPPQEFIQLFPCRPPQANTTHQVPKGHDLDLSIAPPDPVSLGKLAPQNGAGAISVV